VKHPVDYSDPAIDRRLRLASELRSLCLSLARTKPTRETPAKEKLEKPASR
jgi:hypothetical protein